MLIEAVLGSDPNDNEMLPKKMQSFDWPLLLLLFLSLVCKFSSFKIKFKLVALPKKGQKNKKNKSKIAS